MKSPSRRPHKLLRWLSPRLLPTGAAVDARWILAARAVRAFADGCVALLLPTYLLALGFGPLAIGSIITATLIGSALLTLTLGASAHRFQRRSLLRGACLLMLATGLLFGSVTAFWPLLLVAFAGTINPTAGDVSVFLPLEHTVLSQSVDAADRTALFARYSLIGAIAGSFGVLTAALPAQLSIHADVTNAVAMRGFFVMYGMLALVALLLYRRLTPAVEASVEAPPVALGPSRGIVVRLTALFCIDSFGSGFFVQSLLALWLYQRFGLSVAATATILFWTSLCAAVSFLLAVPISRRFGLINTMVFTHLPANLCLVALPFAPTLPIAIALLLVRGLLAQMDVPTRNSYVMAVVTPPERPAAASAAAAPRSLAAAISPLFAGYLFGLSPFGWPLVIGGALKVIYDLLLLSGFRRIRPSEEQ
jgi:MFS family permease